MEATTRLYSSWLDRASECWCVFVRRRFFPRVSLNFFENQINNILVVGENSLFLVVCTKRILLY